MESWLFLSNKLAFYKIKTYRKPNTKWNGNNFVGEGPYLTIKDLLHPTSDCDRKGSGGFKQV